jgi:small subunit ribosomal protein S20
MPNHKSAKKRSRQNIVRSGINGKALTRVKTNINKFSELLKNKNKEDLDKSLSLINSSLSRAAKMGLIRKQFVSRKLSSLSKKIKNI